METFPAIPRRIMTETSAVVHRRGRWARAWRAEFCRFVSLRVQGVLLAVASAGAIALGVGRLFALGLGAPDEQILNAVAAGGDISPFFVGLGAALFASADLSSRQFALTLLQVKGRVLVFCAKISVLVSTAVITGVGAMLLIAPFAVHRGAGVDRVAIAYWLAVPALHAFFALLGAAIGMIVRSVVGTVFVYLAFIWALPLVVAIAGIWVPSISGPLLQIAPVTLTAAMLDPATQIGAAARFCLMDGVLLAVGFVSLRLWRIR
ncbi:hypothetical protein EDF31_101474 [Curtobacterium sp. PhB142]|uniref:hypothetical protein n=2 Tax=Curtobacterium TaxID=2034 RepID=UPI001048B86C|nr:hypothetical protein [Curtobacterium sp. PhB134]TCL88630.1 hypothetical protein EDF31_101474 [Curtobacterium sp. PhB142]TCM04007.1 hypothetical protein EDF26_102220 [Curtobacterium sp. PhB134]